MKKTLLVLTVVLMAIGASAAWAQEPTTEPGLFFTITNKCDSPVRGFAVGDKLCLLQITTATFMRAIFQGDMVSGQDKSAMACAGDDGNGVVLFVPPPGVATQAVKVTVKPNETVPIPDNFCGIGMSEEAAGNEQLKVE